MGTVSNLHQISASVFVDHCKSKFGWTDLSKDVIMDLGCGEEIFCGISILEKFPDVRAILAIDKDLKALRKIRSNPKDKIHCDFGDIEKRSSLEKYESKVTKVVSTHMFHQLKDKKTAFQNVYHLLQPGGEAAVLFVVKSQVYEWITNLLKNPKWKEIYQGHFVVDLYSDGFETTHYQEMVQKIGFKIVDCFVDQRVIPYPSDEVCKKALHQMLCNSFKVPPETVAEFQEDSFQIFVKIGGRNEEGKPCYRSLELYLLLMKPAKESFSMTQRNQDS